MGAGQFQRGSSTPPARRHTAAARLASATRTPSPSALSPSTCTAIPSTFSTLWALHNRLFDRIVGLKYFNVFGPYEDHKADMRSVVAKAYDEIHQTGKLPCSSRTLTA